MRATSVRGKLLSANLVSNAGVIQRGCRSNTGVIQELYRGNAGVIQELYGEDTGVIQELYFISMTPPNVPITLPIPQQQKNKVVRNVREVTGALLAPPP